MSAVLPRRLISTRMTLLAGFVAMMGIGAAEGVQAVLDGVASSVYLLTNIVGAVPFGGWAGLAVVAGLLWRFPQWESWAGALLSIGFIGMIGAASVTFEDFAAQKCLGSKAGTGAYFAGRLILDKQGDCGAPIIVDFRKAPPVSLGGFKGLIRRHGVYVGKARYLPGIMECHGFVEAVKHGRGGLGEGLLVNGVPVAHAACLWHRQNAISLK